MSLTVTFLHPEAQPDHVGMIPEFMSEHDLRPAKEQIHGNYGHGGGWHTIPGFRLVWGKVNDTEIPCLQYPGDPRLLPLAVMRLRQERIFVFEYGITMIVQKDGSFEVARLD